jgi:hypothetical protein
MPLGDGVVVMVTDDHIASAELLAEISPVWAVRTSASEAVAQRIWAIEPRPDARERGLTLFAADESPEETLLAVIDEVELHHGPASGAPALQTIVVLGVGATDRVEETFRSLGYAQITPTVSGFVARRE